MHVFCRRWFGLDYNIMISHFKTIEEIIEDPDCCPFPIGVFPNFMGINLASVDSITWQAQDDGQLVNLSIHFKPDNG